MQSPKCKVHTPEGARLVWILCLLPVAFFLFTASCAQRVLNLPAGRGTPLPLGAELHAEASTACSGVRTLTAELALGGRADTHRVSGRALVGFRLPDAMRLEGLAPIGEPAFILAARGGTATLLLPRDDRVLRGAKAEDVLGALTGVTLAPADLQAILTGCVVPAPKVAFASEQGSWVILELDGGAVLYLRRDRDRLQLRAARRGDWQIEYSDWQGDFPRTVRLVSTGKDTIDMTARLSQIETNVDLEDKAFAVDVPRDAIPITLEELRQAGPLRGNIDRSTQRR